MFLSVDGTFWIQLINFGIFFLVLNSLFLKPVVRAIQERRAYIDGVARDYERYRAQTKKIDDETARVTVEARRDAAELFAKARAAATAEAETIRADYASRAAGIVEQARAQLRNENAQADAKRPELAASLADVLIKRALDETGTAA